MGNKKADITASSHEQDGVANAAIDALRVMDSLPDTAARVDYIDLLMIAAIEAMRALVGENEAKDWMVRRCEDALQMEPALMVRRMN